MVKITLISVVTALIAFCQVVSATLPTRRGYRAGLLPFAKVAASFQKEAAAYAAALESLKVLDLLALSKHIHSKVALDIWYEKDKKQYLEATTKKVELVAELYKSLKKEIIAAMQKRVGKNYVPSDFGTLLAWYYGLLTFNETLETLRQSPGANVSVSVNVVTNFFGDTVLSEAKDISRLLEDAEIGELSRLLSSNQGSKAYAISYAILQHAIKIHRKSPSNYLSYIVRSLMTHHISAVIQAGNPKHLCRLYENLPIGVKRVFYAGIPQHAMLVVVIRQGLDPDFKKDSYRAFMYNSGYGIDKYHVSKELGAKKIARYSPFAVLDGLTWEELERSQFHNSTLEAVYHNGKKLVKFTASSDNVVRPQGAGTCTGMSLNFLIKYDIPEGVCRSKEIATQLGTISFKGPNENILAEHQIKLSLLDGAVDFVVDQDVKRRAATEEIEKHHYDKFPKELDDKIVDVVTNQEASQQNVHFLQVLIPTAYNERLQAILKVEDKQLAADMLAQFKASWLQNSQKHVGSQPWEVIKEAVESLLRDTEHSVLGASELSRKSFEGERLSLVQGIDLACLSSIRALKTRNAFMQCILQAASTAGNSKTFLDFIDALLPEKPLSTVEQYLLVTTAALSKKYALVKTLVQKHHISLYFPTIKAGDLVRSLEDLATLEGTDLVQQLAEHFMSAYGQPFQANSSILQLTFRGKEKTHLLAYSFGEFLRLHNKPLEILHVLLLLLDPGFNASRADERFAAKLDAFAIIEEIAEGLFADTSFNGETYFSEHAKLLLEEAFLQRLESTADVSKMYILLYAFGIPTNFTFESSVQCDEKKLDELASRVRTGDILDTAQNLLCCRDQFPARITRSRLAVNTFHKDTRTGELIIQNEAMHADAIVKFLSQCTSVKSLKRFLKVQRTSDVFKAHYDWIIVRLQVPKDASEKYLKLFLRNFGPLKEHNFTHYFANVLYSNLENLLEIKSMCDMLQMGASETALLKADTIQQTPYMAIPRPLTVPANKDTIELVAQQIFKCPPPLNIRQTVSAILLAAAVPTELFESKLIGLFKAEAFKTSASLTYLALNTAFSGQIEPGENHLGDFLKDQDVSLFTFLPFPLSPSDRSVSDISTEKEVEEYAASLFSSAGFKWPSFASWARFMEDDTDFSKKLLKDFLALPQPQKYKLLVDLALSSSSEDDLLPLIKLFCKDTEWMVPFNPAAIYLVRLALHRRQFFKAFESWVFSSLPTENDPWCTHDGVPLPDNADIGHFDDKASSAQLACEAFRRYGRVERKKPEVSVSVF